MMYPKVEGFDVAGGGVSSLSFPLHFMLPKNRGGPFRDKRRSLRVLTFETYHPYP